MKTKQRDARGERRHSVNSVAELFLSTFPPSSTFLLSAFLLPTFFSALYLFVGYFHAVSLSCCLLPDVLLAVSFPAVGLSSSSSDIYFPKIYLTQSVVALT